VIRTRTWRNSIAQSIYFTADREAGRLLRQVGRENTAGERRDLLNALASLQEMMAVTAENWADYGEDRTTPQEMRYEARLVALVARTEHALASGAEWTAGNDEFETFPGVRDILVRMSGTTSLCERAAQLDELADALFAVVGGQVVQVLYVLGWSYQRSAQRATGRTWHRFVPWLRRRPPVSTAGTAAAVGQADDEI
jgi:hypothetical protein